MKKHCLNSNKMFLSIFLLVVFSISSAFLNVGDVGATDKPLNYGYFYNTYFPNAVGGSGPQFIKGGIHVNSKAGFISVIKGLYGHTGEDHVAAAYIIQTMRGSPWDHSFPDSNDITDWETKINNPNIGFSGNAWYERADLNSTLTPSTLGPTDGVEYNYPSQGGKESVVFYSGNTAVYALAIPCGNPVGHLPGLSASSSCDPILVAVEPKTYPAVPANSHLGSSSYVPPNTVPVKVSTSIQSWGPYTGPTTLDLTKRHTTGDPYTVKFTETSKHIIGYTDVSKTVSDYGWIPEYSRTPGGVKYQSGQHWGVVGHHQVYDHTNTNYSGPNSWTSVVGPCYDYKLTASVIGTYTAVEADALISVGSKIGSASYTGKYHTHSVSGTQWQLVQLVIPPNGSVPNLPNGNSSDDPCTRLGSVGCLTIASGNNVIGTSGWSPPSKSITIGDYLAGTKVCFALGVQPRAGWSQTIDSQWNHSAFSLKGSCVIIVKKPKVQIWGGDLLTGGLVATSTSVKNIAGLHTFGSWVEYGIFAAGSITGAASGSAFAGPGLANATTCKSSTLSFTNAGSSVCTTNTAIGGYVTTQSIPDVVASFSATGSTISTGTVTPNDLIASSGTYIGTRTGDLTLNSSTLAPGKSIILKVSGTVTIAGNQTYNSDNNGAKYTSILQLPQLVIIANKIVINSSVTNVDAWLIAKGSSGTIETCEIVGDTINKCNATLTVNGPVMAKKLYLRRTAGSGTGAASGDPAEIFNLRADTYLWAIARATSSGRIQTVYTTELPPRF